MRQGPVSSPESAAALLGLLAALEVFLASLVAEFGEEWVSSGCKDLLQRLETWQRACGPVQKHLTHVDRGGGPHKQGPAASTYAAFADTGVLLDDGKGGPPAKETSTYAAFADTGVLLDDGNGLEKGSPGRETSTYAAFADTGVLLDDGKGLEKVGLPGKGRPAETSTYAGFADTGSLLDDGAGPNEVGFPDKGWLSEAPTYAAFADTGVLLNDGNGLQKNPPPKAVADACGVEIITNESADTSTYAPFPATGWFVDGSKNAMTIDTRRLIGRRFPGHDIHALDGKNDGIEILVSDLTRQTRRPASEPEHSEDVSASKGHVYTAHADVEPFLPTTRSLQPTPDDGTQAALVYYTGFLGPENLVGSFHDRPGGVAKIGSACRAWSDAPPLEAVASLPEDPGIEAGGTPHTYASLCDVEFFLPHRQEVPAVMCLA